MTKKKLTDKQVKAVEKLAKKFDFYALSVATGGISNGVLLELIRYCKRLKPDNKAEILP